MLTSQGFMDSFWTHYVMLEKEFMTTLYYVRLDRENYSTYSDAYIKLLLQIGSEIDVVAKETCKLINPQFNGDNIVDYRSELSGDSGFASTKVNLFNYGIILEPWNNTWLTATGYTKIIWWDVYNKVKHQRTDQVNINSITKASYKFADLENVINALGGLYHLLLHSYYLTLKNEGKTVKIPLPGSRLFKLQGPMWNNVDFGFDTIYIEENPGEIIIETATKPY